MEPHLQQEDVQHEQVLFLLQGALIILSKKNEAQEVTHPGAGGADNLQQEDMYCFAFDEMLFTLNTRIIATFRGYPMSYLSQFVFNILRNQSICLVKYKAQF